MKRNHPWWDHAGHYFGPSFEPDPTPPGGDPAGGGAGGGSTPPPGDGPFRQFATQAEFDNHAAGIRAAAKRDAVKELATQLGMSIEDAKKLIDARAEAEQAKLTEVERREKAAADKEAAAAAREEAANRRTRLADVSLALTTTGVRADRVTYATDAVMRGLADDADEETIKAAVEKVKTDVPEFFGETQGEGRPPAHNPGAGPRNSGSNGGKPSGLEAGRERSRAAMKARTGQKDQQGDPFAAVGRAVGA